MQRTYRHFGFWMVCLVVAVFVGDAFARQAVVVTKDGKRFEGELLREENDRVVLEIAGISTPILRSDIQTFDIKKSIDEQYQERRAELADDDVDGRYNLAYFLFENDALNLAENELRELRQLSPESEKVRLLETVVQERKKLLQSQQARPARPVTPRPATPADSRGSDQTDGRLSPEQVNIIRVWELPNDFVNSGPPIQIPPKVVNEFLEKYRDQPGMPRGRNAERAFRGASDARKLQLMMEKRAREFYGEVKVTRDPPAMLEYRSQIHNRYVLNYCATNECHGNTAAPGDLYLFQAQPTSDQTVYTDFFILSRMRTARGAMIDRDRPNLSLLLQYGMAPEAAAFPHPDVPGWRPRFRGSDDPTVRRYAQIIDELYTNPNYGISYVPPHRAAKPAAATEQTAEPAGE